MEWSFDDDILLEIDDDMIKDIPSIYFGEQDIDNDISAAISILYDLVIDVVDVYIPDAL